MNGWNWPPLPELASFALVSLSSIFFTVDPLGTVPAFLAMGADENEERTRRIVRHASWTCFWILIAFASAGSLIFKLFGITLPAFKIAGGLLLFLIALEMMQAHRSLTKESEADRVAGRSKEDFGIIPLGMPMLAGPGAISTVMVLMGQTRLWWQAIPIFLAIAFTSFATYYTLAFGANTRLMGLVLSAMAVQFVLNGILDIWPNAAGR
jgi:multiple antibiotic resistance protein